jgi:hypothetical protein
MCRIVEAIYQMLGTKLDENDENIPEKRVEMIFNRLDTVNNNYILTNILNLELVVNKFKIMT